jgi:hypothetical protein
MSHITTKEADNADQQIKDFIALRRAVARFPGAILHEGKTKFTAYGTEANRVNNVRHVIGVQDKRYEIGVFESQKFPGTMSLAFDTYSGELEPIFGRGCENLLMFYHAEALRSVAQRNGDMYSEQVLPDGTIIAEMDTTVRLGV